LFAFPLFAVEALRVSLRERAADEPEIVGLGPRVRDLWRRADKAKLGRLLVAFAVPIVIVLAIAFFHNRARFGDPFDFGYRYLAIQWRPRMEKWGLFHYHYLGR